MKANTKTVTEIRYIGKTIRILTVDPLLYKVTKSALLIFDKDTWTNVKE